MAKLKRSWKGDTDGVGRKGGGIGRERERGGGGVGWGSRRVVG